MNYLNIAQMFLNKNQSNLQQSPFLQSGLNAIRNGDAKAGEDLANHILQSYGLTKEQALSIAKKKGLI